MLNAMRRGANTWVIKLLLVMLALSFGIWGVGDYVNSRGQKAVAVVDGEGIGPGEFAKAYEDQLNALRKRVGEAFDKKKFEETFQLRQQTLSRLIDQRLILAAATSLGLTVSPDFLRRRIAANPLFQEGGGFSMGRYDLVMRNSGLTPREFEGEIVKEILVGQLQNSLMDATAPLPTLLLQDTFQMENERRVIEALLLKPLDLEPEIQPDDEALTAFLTENRERYRTPARLKLRYLVLSTDAVRDSVTASPEDMEAFYQEHLDEWHRQEVRRARHILIPIAPGEGGEEAALKKIQGLAARIGAGESFEEVARSESQDVTASQGGDLGEVTPGLMTKSFDEALFSLPQGKVSDPVKTTFGYHLIRVDSVTPGREKPLAEVESEVKERVLRQKAVDQVYARSETLEEQLYVSGDLKALAQENNLTFREIDFQSGQDPARQGVEADPKFMETAFATPKGEISALVELADGQFFALEVVDRTEPEFQSLDQAREALLIDYRKEKSREMAKEHVQTMLKALADGGTWEDAHKLHAAALSHRWEAVTFNGAGEKDGPPLEVRKAAFRTSPNKPLFPEPVESRDGLYVVRLEKVVPADPAALPEAEAKLRPRLEAGLAGEMFEAYLYGLRSRSEVVIHEDVLNRF
ncbi:MAG: SurA N-terminal domain-containing protein [Magnetococcales bacterium]|nr:SurA N-terminal domain-containing protein [Magnetococcales bacterium]MBF0156212.1 SurA N-terminal domain-containing protein [Magnetococcales bacterium]